MSAKAQDKACEVSVRVRPLSKMEVDVNASIIVRMKADAVELISSSVGPAFRATYNNAFWSCNTFIPGNRNENMAQEPLYEKIGVPIVNHLFSGYNTSVIAMGGPGVGKTYTLLGEEHDEGIARRLGRDLFNSSKKAERNNKEVMLDVSMVEIYDEKVRDLLNPDPEVFNGKPLIVREHPKMGAVIDNVAQFTVGSQRDLNDLIQTGQLVRSTGAKIASSRTANGHLFLILNVKQIGNDNLTRESKLVMAAIGAPTEVQTGSINSSLTNLTKVISQLAGEGNAKKDQIVYKNSAVTTLLRDSLGGTSKCQFIGCISPANSQYEKTVNTLVTSNHAKKVVNKETVHQVSNAQFMQTLNNEAKTANDQWLAKYWAMNLHERREHTKRLMEQRQNNLELLRLKWESMGGDSGDLAALTSAKEAKVQELLSRLHQMMMDNSEQDRIDEIRKQIAHLESQNQATGPQHQAEPEEEIAASDLNAPPETETKAFVPQEVPEQPAKEETDEIDYGELEAAIEADEKKGDDDDVNIEEDEAEPQAEEEEEPEEDDVDIDEAELAAAEAEEEERARLEAEDEDIDIEDEEEIEVEEEEEEKAPPAKQPAKSPATPQAEIKGDDITRDEEDKAKQQGNQIVAPNSNIPTVEIKSHELPNNRYLHEPFRVVKIDEDALLKNRKERVWEIDFFGKKFGNLDLSGYASFSQPSTNLYRVERHSVNATRLTLYFFEAPHPYDLQFMSTERCQRFFELAMLLRRNSVLWCPSLVPSNENDALLKVEGTTIDRPNGKVLKVKGESNLTVAKMPYEVIDLWFGGLSLNKKPLPRSTSILTGFMPKAVHEVYVIGLTNVPSQYMGTTEISDYFLSYLGPGLFFVLTSTAVNPMDKKRDLNNVFVVICRRSFIVRISRLEAMELVVPAKDSVGRQDFSAVGASLHINEASLAFVLINATHNHVDASARTAAIRGLLSNFPSGNTHVDIGVRFDYLVVAGALGFGGDFTSDDNLVKQMKAGNLMSDMTEDKAPPTISSLTNPMRVFYVVRPRTCRLDMKAYQSSRAIDNANVYCNMDIFCQRPFLSTFGIKVPRTRLLFSGFSVAGQRIPQVVKPELLLYAFWIEGSPVSVPLAYNGESFDVIGEVAPVLPVVHNPEFIRLQYIDFTLSGTLPGARDKKRMVIASGTLALKNVAQLGEQSEFTVPTYYRGCSVGALQGQVSFVYNETTAAELEGAGVAPSEKNAYIIACSENQVQDTKGNWYPVSLDNDGAVEWSQIDTYTEPREKDSVQLPDSNWKWLTSWRHDTRSEDSEGWGYGNMVASATEAKKKREHGYRRRRWTRVMQAPDMTTLHSFIKALYEGDISI